MTRLNAKRWTADVKRSTRTTYEAAEIILHASSEENARAWFADTFEVPLGWVRARRLET